MDVKSAFLYGTIEEEVYVHQPLGFVDPAHPNKVYKVVKALYGLHQAPRAWKRGWAELSVLVRVWDISRQRERAGVCFSVVGRCSESGVAHIGECGDGLGLVLRVRVSYYDSVTEGGGTVVMLRRSARKDGESASERAPRCECTMRENMQITGIGSMHAARHGALTGVIWYGAADDGDVFPVGEDLSNYLVGAERLARGVGRRDQQTGRCQFLGRRLISWQCKKQTIVANSTTEAEYVAAAHCCGQVLWIQNQMMDYGFNFMNTKIHIDNESTICVVKNPVYHSRTKHIEIRHHFIRDCYEKRLIDVLKIHTDSNVADLLTKGFEVHGRRVLEGAESIALHGGEVVFLLMSTDSAVTYTSVHSKARSWSIPSEDPSEEAASQLREQAPRSPE
ncbi:putative ribonuclease H-like domain-containing protein [Tanacetum coccineum]